MFTLEQAARVVSRTLNFPERKRTVSGVSTDTRTIKPGELFIALTGPNFDGHDFLNEAFRKGAAGAVTGREIPAPGPVIQVPDTLQALQRIACWYRHQLSLPVIAVTGSTGKTTTKECIATALSQVFKVRMGFGNWNNHIGIPLNVLRIHPDDQCAVLEMGANHIGEIRDLCRIAQPTVGVITGVQPAHLEGFGSLEGVYRAKLELADYVLAAGGAMIANGDDPELVRRLRSRGGSLITFGAASTNDIRLSELQAGRGLIAFEVNGAARFRLAGHGRFNAMNALAAIAVAHYFKMDLGELAEAWEAIPPVPGRFRCLELGSADIQVVDDSYNANPHAFEQAVRSFAQEAGTRRKIVVCGDMLELGNEGPVYHEALGRVLAEEGMDHVIGVGPLSRWTLNLFSKLSGTAQSRHFETVEEAVPYVNSLLAEGDSVLIKGSNGMRLGTLAAALEAKFRALSYSFSAE